MRPLTSSELLAVWENGFEQTNIEKAVSLLAVATITDDTESVFNWSIEERDIKLFYLRSWMFGNQFINIANCPNCQEKVEWEMDLKNFELPTLPLSSKKKFQLKKGNFFIQYRLPNSKDLITTNPTQILANCLIDLKKDNIDLSIDSLPKSILDALGEEMEKVSPISNVVVRLNCPACQHQWEQLFDILSYLWTEIDAWAKKLLQEIYQLAHAFKWSEKDILNMSARRRQFYLEMIQA